ncbi:MAG: hypothetical protein WC095_02350 [Candidatus Paceibacterota bacterium]
MENITPPNFIKNIPEVGSFLVLHSSILYIILGIFFLGYLVVSTILIYHWNTYGMRAQGVIVAEILYLFVSLSLFSIAVLSLYYF